MREPIKSGRRGRGAASNRAGRFEGQRTEPLDEAPPEARLATRVLPERTRKILTTNDSPDVPFDVSINPYKGCEHGCVYCFARATHPYLGLSAGLDFETRIFSKPDAASLLGSELARPGYRPRVIALGTNTDPYQPVEKQARITRGILECLLAHRHPVGIVTKSDLVLRDQDLLAEMARRRLVRVFISITTLDADLARRMEPRAAAPWRRLETIAALVAAGIPTGVLASPMIPALNDTEMEIILEASAGAGAGYAGYIVLRLPHEVKDLFIEWLEIHYPRRAQRVLALLRQIHGEALYDSTYSRRMRGAGPYAELLRRRFRLACRRHSLAQDPEPLATDRFRPPGAVAVQLPLLPR